MKDHFNEHSDRRMTSSYFLFFDGTRTLHAPHTGLQTDGIVMSDLWIDVQIAL